MVNRAFTEEDWRVLLFTIRERRCTPIIGPGVSSRHLPTSNQIAERLALQFDYPLHRNRELSQVAQFITIQNGRDMLSHILEEHFQVNTSLNFNDRDEPYGALADLPFPLYITTNMDDLMLQALKQRNKDAHRELCQPARMSPSEKSQLASGFQMDPANPIVFHLYGVPTVPESLVVTENDYLDFLVRLGREDRLLPLAIQRALGRSSFLFLGFPFDGWEFRVLFKALSKFMRIGTYRHLAVTLPAVSAEAGNDERSAYSEYFERYLERYRVRIYWGTVQDFAAELRSRMEDLNG